jgi:hypothetical protein
LHLHRHRCVSVASRLFFAAFASPCALATLNVFAAARFFLFPAWPVGFLFCVLAVFFSLGKLAGVLGMYLARTNFQKVLSMFNAQLAPLEDKTGAPSKGSIAEAFSP